MKEEQTLESLWQLLTDYLKNRTNTDEPVLRYRSPEELKQELNLSIPEKAQPPEKMVEAIAKYLQFMPRTSHPLFMNQLYSGSPLPGIAGDLVSAVTNTSMATYEISPVATLLEEALIEKMNSLTGYAEGDGIFCTGGSNGNLLGMFNARHARFPEIKRTGFSAIAGKKLTIFISQNAHYSFRKGANLLGIGTENVIEVATDERGRMIPDALLAAVRDSRSRGETPFFIGATCGTTVLGAFDPLEDLADIATEEDLWLHGDGAWGGPVLLCNRHRHLLKGVERTDSFSWDAHKLMGAPVVSTAFLIRQKGQLYSSACDPGTEYLFHDVDHQYDTGVKSLQCGRKVDSLKTWLLWQQYGDEGFDRLISKNFELALKAEERIRQEKNLELLAPTHFINVNFRYNDGSIQDLDGFNVELRERLLRSGKAMVNYSTLKGRITIRLVLQNLEHSEADVQEFFDRFLAEAAAMSRS